MINEGKIVFNTTGGKQSSFRNTWFCVSIIKLELLFNIINLNSQHYCSANYRVKNVISSPFPCMWNIKSTMWKCLQAFAQLSSHQMCIDNLSVHAPLAELGHQRLRTCLKMSVQLPVFISLFLLWVPPITCSTLPYLTLRTTEFSLSQTTLRLWSVWSSVLKCLSCSRCQMLCVELSAGSKAREI